MTVSKDRDAMDRYLDRAVKKLMQDPGAVDAILRNVLADGAYLEVTVEWEPEDLASAGEGVHGTFDVWAPRLTKRERQGLAEYYGMWQYKDSEGNTRLTGDKEA